MSQSWGDITSGMVGRLAYCGSLSNVSCQPPPDKTPEEQTPWMMAPDLEVPPCPRPRLSHSVYAQGPLAEERFWGLGAGDG